MKRITFFVLMIIAFFPSSMVGKDVKKGYRGFVDVIFQVAPYKLASVYDYEQNEFVFSNVYRESFISVGIATSHGYQFNPHFFVGLGISGEYCEIYRAARLGTFLHVRTDQTFGKYTPFAEIRSGLKTDPDGSFFISPAVGYRFNFGHRTNLNIGIGVNLRYWTNDFCPTWYIKSGDWYKYLGVDTKIGFKPYFDFKVGLDF